MIFTGYTSPLAGFEFHDRDTTSNSVYEFIMYKSREGHMLIARLKKDGTEQRFAFFNKSEDRDTVWADRDTYTYKDIDRAG